jgi:hypothetical protein
VRSVNAAPATITTSLIASSSVTTPVSISNNPGIQTGSIRVVQPHQLTGTTATTIIAPVSIHTYDSKLYRVSFMFYPCLNGAGIAHVV